MPANEQTWRNIPRMHRVFAVSGIALFIATIWVFWNDQNREWRDVQTTNVSIDTNMNRWRQEQFQTDTAQQTKTEKYEQKLKADAAPIDRKHTDEFTELVRKFHADMEAIGDDTRVSYNPDDIENRRVVQATSAEGAANAWTEAAAAEAQLKSAREKLVEARGAGNEDAIAEARQAVTTAENESRAAVQNAETASQASGRERQGIVADLDAIVTRIRNEENLAAGRRKFKSAELDEARANVDIGVRDNVGDAKMQQLADRVRDVETEVAALNINYQKKNESRVALAKVIGEITADQVAANKEYDQAQADLRGLQQAYQQREETYFTNTFPFLGKKVLNLPILNAFNPPQKIENLWSEGLEQNYNFRNVRRFDRCTTCHQLMQRSLPGQPLDPAYIHQRDLVMLVTPPEAVPPEVDPQAPVRERLEKIYGIRLAEEGLVNFDDVTVTLVLPESPAARAEVQNETGDTTLPADEIRESVAQFVSVDVQPENFKVLPGLMVGDVIVFVEDEKANRGPTRVADRLMDAIGSGRPVKLTVRRGLPNPHTTHPRLDLFAGDASPHPMGTFGCTICHEGQGNATAFKWVSHTPNDTEDHPTQSTEWAREHGWFDNHHWIYPMWPKRFAESGCLKCHHEVVELEPSERFPEPPAPKVTHGYHLIRKYGCYGCHEVNGYDGPNKRIGPDLRAEPNFYASALQLGHLLAPRLTDLEQMHEQAKSRFESLHGDGANASEEDAAKAEAEVNRLAGHVEAVRRALELAPEVAAKNYDAASRNELYQLFTIDAAIQNPAERAFTVEMHRTAGVLKDVEAPGALRKPGPTLRYTRAKLDPVFIYDWTNNPKNFRPTTRMPQFFGLWDHLAEEPQSLARSKELEPVEIHGIVEYLRKTSQQFVPLERPEGIAEDSTADRIRRGKELFETRGCLACHEHHDFPRATEFRGEKSIVQGPDLSALAEKFDPKRNPQGRDWLYSWIKNPTRYNVRTLMPNVFLDPIEEQRPTGNKLESGADETAPALIDPAADIVEYLLDPEHLARAAQPPAEKSGDEAAGEEPTDKPQGIHEHAAGRHDHEPWKPVEEAFKEVDPAALKTLVKEYLRESFHESRLDDYYENGLPEEMRGELKVAEQDLVVRKGETLSDEQRLFYIGRRSISKFGCYGCHDVPGFEDAKPIGTGLADWGRKDPSRLAFEHITHYLQHGHGHATGHAAPRAPQNSAAPVIPGDKPASAPGDGPRPGEASNDGHSDEAHGHGDAHDVGAEHGDELPVFYERAINRGHRSGFIYQKLREPRSYDYKKANNKKYNDRLRMPEFPFSVEEREAVITFVLGLVAEPPGPKYVYKPSERQKAIIAGKQVLETFNCGGCHVLEGERWQLLFSPETFDERSTPLEPNFVKQHFSPEEIAKSLATNPAGKATAHLMGLPALNTDDALPAVFDEGSAIGPRSEGRFSPSAVAYGFDLYQKTVLAGKPYPTGLAPVEVPGNVVVKKYPSTGGFLARYLPPVVLAMEVKVNPAMKGKGNETYGWLPPPLMGEGEKVQTNWLYEFLMEPYAIRPATFLRMPKFNLSPDDTSRLVNYFAAMDNAQYPYELDPRRQTDHLASKQAGYAKTAKEEGENEVNQNRLHAALNYVTKTQCVQCHQVGDYEPTGSQRAKAPNLAQVYRRLRPDYTRRWLANPKRYLPYTPMPVNIFKYDPEKEYLGAAETQKFYHGTSLEQLDAVTDLLMNFDTYSRQNTNIADMVPPQPMGEKPAEEPAETTGAQ